MRRDTLIGQVVADRFKVISLIGEGGTGRVYLAEHSVLERPFAIKVLRPELTSDPNAAERFRREARAASRMQHRNIVYISDFGSLPDERLYLVMEYIPGEELAALLHREGRLPAPRAAAILLQVVEALDYAHEQGVVHRDLKAENVLLTEERRHRDVVKILDFGLAKILEGAGTLDTLSAKGQIFGTPAYISPEQIVGDPVDPRADIYAIGVLAFELVVGRTPFTGSLMELLVAHRKTVPPLPSQAAPEANIPACFDEIVSRAMRKRPEHRYRTAAEIGDILREYLSGVGPDRAPAAPRPGASIWPVREAGGGASDSAAQAGPEPPEAAPTSAADNATQQRLRPLCRRAAQALCATGQAPTWLADALDGILQREAQLAAHQAELARIEAQAEAVDVSGREQESQLRYAIIELGMEKARRQRALPGDGAGPAEANPAPEIADLAYQISELEHRLAAVVQAREQQLDALDEQAHGLRRAMEDAAAALARAEDALVEQLLALRPQVAHLPEMSAAFAQIDALRGGSAPTS